MNIPSNFICFLDFFAFPSLKIQVEHLPCTMQTEMSNMLRPMTAGHHLKRNIRPTSFNQQLDHTFWIFEAYFPCLTVDQLQYSLVILKKKSKHIICDVQNRFCAEFCQTSRKNFPPTTDKRQTQRSFFVLNLAPLTPAPIYVPDRIP